MQAVEVLDGLLEAYGDEETDGDGGDVDEEVFPGVGGAGGRLAFRLRGFRVAVIVSHVLRARHGVAGNWRITRLRLRPGRG